MGSSTMARPGRLGRLGPWVVIACVAPLALTLAGCGDAGPPRRAVAGSITLDGKPLPSGTIVFAPLDGVTAAVADVTDGAYWIAPGKGPAAGRYQVEVRAEASTGKRIPHPDLPGETIEEVRDLIPPRYNARTELGSEVRPGAANIFDLDLASGAARARTRN